MTEAAELTEIQKVEQEYGFVFGVGDAHESAKAKPLITVVCSNPKCAQQNQHVEIFTDSAQPIHCGGCFTVLHCDHDESDPVVTTEGTFGAPVQITRTACTKCGVAIAETNVVMPAMKLKDLPVSMLPNLPTG